MAGNDDNATRELVHNRVREAFPDLTASEQTGIAGAFLDALDAERSYPKLNGSLTDERRTAAMQLWKEIKAEVTGADPEPGDTGADDGQGGQRKSQATALVEVAEANVQRFFHHESDGYAQFPVSGHLEVARIRNRRFKRFLQRLYFVQHRKAPGGQAVQDAVTVLEGKALFEGEEIPVYTRVAPGDSENEWHIDLGDESHRAVHISAGRWEIVDTPPVMFTRPPGLMALPEPDRNGSIDELRPFVNVDDGDDGGDGAQHTPSNDWLLFLAWMTAAVRPWGPYPVLVLLGEQGSAKSSTATAAGNLLDPTEADRQTLPRDEQSLAIWAMHSHLIRIDNVSSVPGWLSDALSRLSTGGGALYRRLYSDDELQVFRAQRPVIVNGISDFIHRPDLLQRSIVLYLPRIEDAQRRDEATMEARFRKAAPRIFGGLLNLVAKAAALHPVETPSLPRMADFARWACAVEQALELKAGAFLTAYDENQRAGSDTVLQGNPVALAIKALVTARFGFEGTATELLEALNNHADESTRRAKRWPATGAQLGKDLARAAPLLRNAGIEVEHERGGAQRTVSLRLGKQEPVTPVTPVTDRGGHDSNDSNDGPMHTQSLNFEQTDAERLEARAEELRRSIDEQGDESLLPEYEQLLDQIAELEGGGQ